MKAQRQPTLEVQYVPYLGEVGCGSSLPAHDNVYPFMPKDELIPVPLPAGMTPRDAGVMTVRGMSLTDFNVFDGDRMVVQTRFSSFRDIDEDTVCVVYIHATGELVAKRIVRGANKITLKASGGGIRDIECSVDDVEIRGIVIDYLIDAKTQMARAREAKARLNGIGRRKRDELTPRLWTEKKADDDIPF
jgi:SOS-response transcriptional repressor LexA